MNILPYIVFIINEKNQIIIIQCLLDKFSAIRRVTEEYLLIFICMDMNRFTEESHLTWFINKFNTIRKLIEKYISVSTTSQRVDGSKVCKDRPS